VKQICGVAEYADGAGLAVEDHIDIIDRDRASCFYLSNVD
jgi:hypothetical protein